MLIPQMIQILPIMQPLIPIRLIVTYCIQFLFKTPGDTIIDMIKLHIFNSSDTDKGTYFIISRCDTDILVILLTCAKDLHRESGLMINIPIGQDSISLFHAREIMHRFPERVIHIKKTEFLIYLPESNL